MTAYISPCSGPPRLRRPARAGMAVVPYRMAGAGADQSLETRLFQVGGHAVQIRQDPRGSGALRPLGPGRADAGDLRISPVA